MDLDYGKHADLVLYYLRSHLVTFMNLANSGVLSDINYLDCEMFVELDFVSFLGSLEIDGRFSCEGPVCWFV